MKKKYFKFSDERNRKYSIVTEIVEEQGTKYVDKYPVYEEGSAHMDNIVRYQELLSKAYPDVTVCKVERHGEGLRFDFVKGHSLQEEYEQYARSQDKASYLALLKEHVAILRGTPENTVVFEETESSREWFGDLSVWNQKNALVVSNFDATAGNVMRTDNGLTFIDYEWVFEFPVPYELVVYHCLRDMYLHEERLESFVPLQSALAAVDVHTEVATLERAYRNFFFHVIREENGESFAEAKMCTMKPKYDICDIVSSTKQIQIESEASRQMYEDIRRKWEEECIEHQRCAHYWKESDLMSRMLRTQLEDALKTIEALQKKETE